MPLKFPMNGVSLDGGATWGQSVPDATPSAAGLMSAAQAGSLTNLVYAVTPTMDFTLSNSGVSFSVPLKQAGFYFVALGVSIFTYTSVGTASGSLTVTAGNNGSHNNVIGSFSVVLSIINALQSGVPIQLSALAFPGPNAVNVDGATEIKVFTAPPAGITAMTGRVAVVGFWVPAT
jgi:hypothetical protein